MTSVTNNNPLSQLSALTPSQLPANVPQAANSDGPSASPATLTSRTVTGSLPAAYAGAAQAVVGYLLNQQGTTDTTTAATSATTAVSATSSATDPSSALSTKSAIGASGLVGGQNASGPSGTTSPSPGSMSPHKAGSDAGKSAKTSGDAHKSGGSGGGSSASSSATTTETETMSDGSVMQITLDASGKVVSETIVKAASQNNAQTGSSGS